MNNPLRDREDSQLPVRTQEGLVRYGINNIYTVESGGQTLECRIKGKVLATNGKWYNPIAAGDRVEIALDPGHTGKAMILGLIDRVSTFSRHNKKRNAPQIIASNLDMLYCVTSPKSPAFRPRFIDRVLIAADQGQMPVGVLINKIDQGTNHIIDQWLEAYQKIGVRVHQVSAVDGTGLETLKEEFAGKKIGFVGQSGVGKSTLLNALFPHAAQEVGELNKKYNKGNHTTCFAILIPWEKGEILDTPGVRDLELQGIHSDTLDAYFPEIAQYVAECGFPGCSHTHEPRCAIKARVETTEISPLRYNSYVRLYQELREQERTYG
jgi:ribosome biogenesis GTPase